MLWLVLSLLSACVPARAVVGPLRVRYDFSDPSLALMDDAVRDLFFKNSMLSEAAKIIGRALLVERVDGPLRLTRKCRSRGNDDHCFLRLDNASQLQKATYKRLWRARSWLIPLHWILNPKTEPHHCRVRRARLDRDLHGLLIFVVGVVLFRVAAAVDLLADLLVPAAPVVVLACRIAVPGLAPHTSRRVVGQWRGARGADCENHDV